MSVKKYLMCVVSYADSKKQEYFETFHSPRNQEYCDYHGFEYLPITDFNTIPNYCKERRIYWYRLFLIRHWITLGRFKTGDIVSHLDADGICASAIMVSALNTDNRKYSVSIVHQLTEEVIDSLSKEPYNYFVFTDLGSGQLSYIKKKFFSNIGHGKKHY